MKKTLSVFGCLVAVFLSGASLRAQNPTTLAELAKLDAATLDGLFRSAPRPDSLPNATTRGLVFFDPGKTLSRVEGRAFGLLWRGKALEGDNGMMKNRVAGAKFITAGMRLGESFTDGEQAVILDYQGYQSRATSFADKARDEIREVSPGLWLGRMWVRGDDGLYTASTWFGLKSR